MKRHFALISLLLVFASSAFSQAGADSKMSQAWVLGGLLSRAGVLHAQGGESALVGRQFAAASSAAARFGLKLPPMPAKTGDKIKDSAAVLNYLLNTTGNPIGGTLTKSFSAEHAVLFEVALKSNILLMMYGPGDSTAAAIANVIRSRATTVKFLNGMTAPLVQLIDKRATYEQVKAELFTLHDLAPKYIAIIEYSREGESKYAAKDYAGSALEFTKAIAVDPGHSEFYFGRGRANLQLNKHAEAIADYTKVIQLEGKSANAPRNLSVTYHNRGLAYGLIGKNALAVADLTQSIKLRPDYANAYKTRAMVYKKMGNAKLAEADLQMAEKYQPGITR